MCTTNSMSAPFEVLLLVLLGLGIVGLHDSWCNTSNTSPVGSLMITLFLNDNLRNVVFSFASAPRGVL